MANISKENYLKAIYSLSKKNEGYISSSEIAKELCVTNAAISEMANRLAKAGYIEYKKYKGIKILAAGEKLAISVLRKHRLWELFLIETLDLSWGDVHLEAEKLEHITSNFLIDKIDEFLKYPKLDPHGAPIPNKDGKYRLNSNDIALQDCEIGKTYKISRVNDKNTELINYLTKLELFLNKKIKIIDKLGFDGSVIIELDNQTHSLSEKLVKNIYITE
jgi:DtxR family Mn-dependent transcriptional regulator